MNKKSTKKTSGDLPGYPAYPASEDIFNAGKEAPDLDPENTDEKKPAGNISGKLNELDFKEDVSGGDLDIPGSEDDNAMEDIGSEDEENNLYSLGGDNHDD